MTLLALNYSALLSAQTAPDLTLKGLDGKLHSMHKYIGKDKWVVVNIWGPKCPPCIEEMPELQSFHDKHKDKAAIVLGIALDFPSFGPANEKEVHQFVEDYFISFPVLLGDAQSIDFLGGGSLKGTPTTLLFSPSGNLEASHVGSITQKIIENFIAKSK
jgi:thiol-disulfide isomerase/thioredoxin